MKKLMMFLCLALILAACQQQADEESLLQEKQGNSKVRYVTDADPSKLPKKSRKQLAQHLAKLATDVPDVHDATAVVLGKYVAVGIDVDKDLDRSRVGVIKYSVAEALRHDPYGKQAVVIADADGVERLRGIGEKMSKGQPINALTDELSQIVARYMPEGPINDPQNTNSNKESVPGKQKKQLDKVEKNQSKEQ
ncbi:YhcN/YlaJ family sporulation lipoprotein [Halobacillus salinarum]|uniref:YhcN/YlaJ family sporulation lipoprotein n=1 Tax=Halobacillus salinarum TaxID=2932257 RepID=A0ABY4EI56_9BACI|nr:YhcN/YlaJ family sporulation lipoprotein [Halobacillus salinarum]UOQ43172.1 YhcN/YlaJ family sporulation lipoprotein [Halobacillus salinarum]